RWLHADAVYDPDPVVQELLNTGFLDTPIPTNALHPAAAVAASGQPLRIPVIDPEAIRAAIAPELWSTFERIRPHSTIVVPLRAHSAPLGSLVFTRHDPGQPAFTTDDLTLAQDLADRAALALANAQIYQQAQVAQQTAVEALARLDALICSVPSGIGYLDRELRYQLVNPALAAINHRTPEEHLGRTPQELLPGLAPRLEPLMRQVLATGEAIRDLELHGQFCAAIGGAHDWLISYFPVREPAGAVTGVGVTVTDVTQTKRMAAILRDTERKLGMLFDILPVGIAILDASGGIVYTNPALEHILRLERTGLLTGAYRTRRYLRPDGTPMPVEEFASTRAFRTHQPVQDIESGIITEMGEPIWTNVSAVPVDFPDWRMVVVTSDITARKQAEETVREREVQLRQAYDAARMGTWRRELATASIHLDAYAQAHFGLDAATVPVTALLERIHPDDCDRWRQALAATTDPAGDGHASAEYRVIHPDGSIHWLAVNAQAYFAGEGAARFAVQTSGTVQDITELKRQEATLAAQTDLLSQTNAELTRALKLKDEFLATVSHELRTPLTAILGYAQLLQRRTHDAAYVTRTVPKLLESAKTQAALIEDLLDVSRIVSGKLRIAPTPIELIDVIHAALDTVRPAVEAKGLELQVVLDPAASAVVGDANRLQQVVWNLLANAAKFTPPGGRIAVQLAVAGRQAELSVRDTGQGISPAFLPEVFAPFRQADSSSQRAHGGLGLGLAIVRHLVELHGGTVGVTSAGVGQGATFTVRLPLVAEGEVSALATAPSRAAATTDGEPFPLAGLRVVVVDDQPAILELLGEILTSEGASIRACTTAAEALALVRAWRPDVLVSDIAMPQADGYWLIQQVRALGPAEGGLVPAVALTAYVRLEDRLQVLAAGFQQYVSKPVDPTELRAVILGLVATGGGSDSAS
ncbi:MAG: PAS domain-containing protein, partial [Chloroflexales bacterium]|nr:PAS domain-containing protein [Chloroflexales bacterium]